MAIRDIFKKAGEVVRGESPQEGAQRRAAEMQIRKEVRVATLQARREQAVRLAKRRQELIAKSRERALTQRFTPQPRAPITPRAASFNFLTGQVRTQSPGMPKRRKSKAKRRRARVRQSSPAPQRFNPLGF